MNELNVRAVAGPDETLERLTEVSRLFASIHGALDQAIGTFEASGGENSQAVIAKLNELEAAHRRVVAIEEAIHAYQGKPVGVDDTDFEAVRAEIGGQLDRLRAAIAAEKLSGDTDL
ncbi:hypothetical protein [Yoonia sp. SDW83-1]|uniref:hypothetical protein n=1 Tax=Yoonia sp. SDW83-1 TaxID=3366945 RepID=UPI00398C773D